MTTDVGSVNKLRTWQDVLDQIDLDELGLTPVEQTLIYYYFETGQKQHRLKRLVSQKGLFKDERINVRNVLESERVTLAINRVRALMNENLEWNLAKSREFSMSMLLRCQRGIEENDGEDREVRRWMKAAEFWKDNVDRISGLLLDRKQIIVEQRYRELSYLKDSELVEIYEDLKDELLELGTYDDEEFTEDAKILEEGIDYKVQHQDKTNDERIDQEMATAENSSEKQNHEEQQKQSSDE